MSEQDKTMLGAKFWRWETISRILTSLGALTIIFGVFEFFQQFEANRAKETLALIESWETRGYRDDYSALRKDIVAYWETVPQEDLNLAKESPKALENLRRSLYRAVVYKGDEATERFERIVYFFNRLGLCVEANLCSQHTAKIFFDDTLNTFLSNFELLLLEEREELPGYGDGIFLLKDAFN